MILFTIYTLIVFIVLLKTKQLENYVQNRWIVPCAWILKVIFIIFISFFPKLLPFASMPDEENYFHDVFIFHDMAIKHPLDYFLYLFDVQRSDQVVQDYYLLTNAWSKMPEFLYNDNRFIIKIHSLLSFISGNSNPLAVHRLFSVIIAMIGQLMMLQFFTKIIGKKSNLLFLFIFFSPAVFFFTAFVLKESLLLLIMGALLITLQKILMENKRDIINIVALLFLIFISCLFRPLYLMTLLLCTSLYFITSKFFTKKQALVYIVLLIASIFTINFIPDIIKGKTAIDLVAQRERRFIDASQGGIFLLNEKYFVRVPFSWTNVRIDSAYRPPHVFINKNVSLMYWDLTNLQDTLYGANKDTSAYKILYYVEKANRTINIPILDSKQGFLHNINVLIQAWKVALFEPFPIKGMADVLAWLENILLLTFLIYALYIGLISKNKLLFFYFISYVFILVSVSAISSPNSGALVRYKLNVTTFLFVLCYKKWIDSGYIVSFPYLSETPR